MRSCRCSADYRQVWRHRRHEEEGEDRGCLEHCLSLHRSRRALSRRHRLLRLHYLSHNYYLQFLQASFSFFSPKPSSNSLQKSAKIDYGNQKINNWIDNFSRIKYEIFDTIFTKVCLLELRNFLLSWKFVGFSWFQMPIYFEYLLNLAHKVVNRQLTAVSSW